MPVQACKAISFSPVFDIHWMLVTDRKQKSIGLPKPLMVRMAQPLGQGT